MNNLTFKTHRRFLIVFTIASSFFLASCTKSLYAEKSHTRTDSSNDSRELKAFIKGGVEKEIKTGKTSANGIIKTARTYLGVPHCMGGHSKKCTDCSGMVMAVFAEHGISLPHGSEEQARYGKMIRDKNELKKGDLVFFIKSYNTSKYITHAGIYLGNNEFIHTSSKKGVSIITLDNSWWKDKFIFGTRVLNE